MALTVYISPICKLKLNKTAYRIGCGKYLQYFHIACVKITVDEIKSNPAVSYNCETCFGGSSVVGVDSRGCVFGTDCGGNAVDGNSGPDQNAGNDFFSNDCIVLLHHLKVT